MYKLLVHGLMFSSVFLIACGGGVKPGTLSEPFQNKQLVVIQAFDLRAGSYGVTFQNGRPAHNMGVSIWDLHCKLEFKNARSELISVDSGRYLLTGQTSTNTQCDRDGCVKLNLFSLQTLSGHEAENLRCRERYDFSNPGSEPKPLTGADLERALGSYIELKPAN